MEPTKKRPGTLLGSGFPGLTSLLHGGIPQNILQGKKIIVTALKNADGNIKETAKNLKVGRATLHRWLNDYPDVRAVLNDIQSGNDLAVARTLIAWEKQFK